MSVHCETRGDELWVVRSGDWEINLTQLKIQYDEVQAEVTRLREALAEVERMRSALEAIERENQA